MYTLKFFRTKFQAIPDELWITNCWGSYDAHCAMGHCGVDYKTGNWTKEAEALNSLFQSIHLNVIDVNDNIDTRYDQPLPKQRILAALDDIEQQQAVEQAQEIVNKRGTFVDGKLTEVEVEKVEK